jgi:tight adherence protein B
MMKSFPLPIVFKYGGVGLLVAGIIWIVVSTLYGDTIFTRYYQHYIAYLDRNLRLLFLPTEPKKIVVGQLVAAVLTIALAVLLEYPMAYLFLALVAIGPTFYLGQKRAEHIKKLEAQVDTFVLSLANSLKTVPSPAAALAAVFPVLPTPTRLEIDRVLKEMRVGSTLEQAILNMASRLGSPAMDSALSALLIGLQVGGNLSTVLENTAATIREMNRLDGVVKTKTSEGRAQLWVLAIFPFGICLVFNYADEGYFTPLQTTFTGYVVTTVAVMFWLASLLAARKILKVDI